MLDLITPVPPSTPIGDLIGGKLHGRDQLFDTTGTDAMGLVGTTPDPNTLLGRLKSINDTGGANHATAIAVLELILGAIEGTAYYPGTQAVTATALPLPVGAATDAKLDTIRTLLAGTLGISASVLPLPVGAASDVKLDAIRALLAGTLGISAAALPLPAGAATDAKVEAVRALLASTLAVSANALPLPAGAATDATLQQIATLLTNARTDTLWTDDSGAYFVRVDKIGVISWVDTSGAPSAAPGVGGRPAAGSTVLLDKSSYQATAGGAGYAAGDFLDHLVTTDPATGSVVGHFWLNTTAEAKLAAAPASANITPLSPLAAGAATASGQTAANTLLSAVQALLAGTLAVSAAALPLPTGAAIAAKQDTGNIALAAIVTALAGSLTTKLDGVSDGALTTGLAPGTAIVTNGYGAVLLSVPAITGGAITVNASLSGTALHALAITNLADNSQVSSITAPGLYQVAAAGSVSYALSTGTATVNLMLKR